MLKARLIFVGARPPGYLIPINSINFEHIIFTESQKAFLREGKIGDVVSYSSKEKDWIMTLFIEEVNPSLIEIAEMVLQLLKEDRIMEHFNAGPLWGNKMDKMIGDLELAIKEAKQ